MKYIRKQKVIRFYSIKIIKRKPINFETGIRKCIEYAKKQLNKNITLILPVSANHQDLEILILNGS